MCFQGARECVQCVRKCFVCYLHLHYDTLSEHGESVRYCPTLAVVSEVGSAGVTRIYERWYMEDMEGIQRTYSVILFLSFSPALTVWNIQYLDDILTNHDQMNYLQGGL